MQEEAKAKIVKLVEKYEAVQRSEKTRSYTEEETKKDFILPLFEALGWSIYDKKEVSAEEHIRSSGRVDYGFYLNGRAKFYVEAKKLDVDIHRAEFAHQAIRYSWNRGVTWAVLTDFESLIVFNAQDIGKDLADKRLFEIPYKEYLERFDQLFWLSREAFEADLIDKEAERVGKKLQKVSVSESLYKDLDTCRDILTTALRVCNKGVAPDLLDEGVQKLLDRLIFLRVAEDRGLEPHILRVLIREAKASDSGEHIYQSMIKKFRELDEVYNSNLFSEHPFETWEEWTGKTEKVIDILYGKKGYYEYDFKVMPADVLGTVYEHYLGYRLSQSKKGVTLATDAKKRKEQGIYYTPTFIVDYIVRNALGQILDKCNSVADLQKIKVLDPACGSGSFLVRALELIAEKYKDFGDTGGTFTKLQILIQNIYGVDLDPQAVEIARLNLLVSALDERMKLPLLSHNIKNGNSLISGTDKELEKQFGKNWRDKKPFNWQEEFPEVFKQGGFDVVIGNPPWGANIDEDVAYYALAYPDSTKRHKDIYKIFVDKAISLLRHGGDLGFILPNTFLYQPRYEDIKEIANKYDNFVINLGESIFQNVQLPSCILILSKQSGANRFIADLARKNRRVLGQLVSTIDQNYMAKPSSAKGIIVKNTGLIFADVFLLKDAGVKHQRVDIGKGEKGKGDLRERIYYHGESKDPRDHPLFTGSDINRYTILSRPSFFLRNNYQSLLDTDEIVYFDKVMMERNLKIVWRQTADRIRAVVIDKKWFANTLQIAVIRDEYSKRLDIYFCLAIFNSRYIDYLYRRKVMETGKVFPQVKLGYLRSFPFVVASRPHQEVIITLVQSIMKDNIDLSRSTENSERWQKLKMEIQKTDRKIDEEVYKLYGLTPEEIKIVENAK